MVAGPAGRGRPHSPFGGRRGWPPRGGERGEAWTLTCALRLRRRCTARCTGLRGPYLGVLGDPGVGGVGAR